MTIVYENLLGREYDAAKANCFTIVRDFYDQNFDISIPTYAIPHDWDADALNLIDQLHDNNGFEKIYNWSFKDLQPGDVLCVAVRSSNPNHLVLYLGDNQILHQPFMQRSRVETIRDFWRRTTCFVLRHKEVKFEKVPLPTITIQELADARYNLQTQ